MLDILTALIGQCPPGMEFMQYLFAFLLVGLGLIIVAYIAHLPFEFIRNRFHNNK